MTSPAIPEALKAKAREARMVLDERCDAARDEELDAIFEDTIALALLQVRNEAIAEERAACIVEAQRRGNNCIDEIATLGSDAYWQGAASSAAIIEIAIRARP